MISEKDIENYINTFLNPLFVSGQYQKNNNMPLNFDGGNFGEGLVCLVYDKIGSGTSGGCSFDTTDGDEIKTLCFFQSKQCVECKHKNGFFVEKCFKCSKTNFKYADDTRACISCTAHFNNFDEIGNYYIVEIKPNQTNFDCSSATVKIFIINKNNKFFNELLNVQKVNGEKIKNLFTDNIEFWLCCPSLSFEAEIQYDIKQSVSNTTIKFMNGEYNVEYVDRHLPSSLFKKAKNKLYRDYCSQINENGYDPVTNYLDIKPEKGTHGKSRGVTERKNKFTREL